MNRIYPYTYQEDTPTPDKPSEIITFWVDEAGNKYIQKLEQEKDRLLNIARKMHTWIFLHTGNEKEVYDELGLTDEENVLLGYHGQFILGDKENE